MDFPRDKLGFTSSHGERTSEAGWLVLNISALDLEGVSKIYVDLDAVEELKQKGVRRSDALERMRSLLGGE